MIDHGTIYKVVKIISEYRIVINGGSKNGISEGDCLEVFAPGKEILDPETGESLGTLDYIKSKLIAEDVLPRMTICVNRETETVPTPSNPTAWMEGTFERLKPLKIDTKEISGGFEGIQKKVVIGDLVRISAG